MAEFKTSFRKGELLRQIALRGLTQEEFATKAGIDNATVLKAIRGKRLNPKTWGKILIALSTIPVLEIPAGMIETAV